MNWETIVISIVGSGVAAYFAAKSGGDVAKEAAIEGAKKAAELSYWSNCIRKCEMLKAEIASLLGGTSAVYSAFFGGKSKESRVFLGEIRYGLMEEIISEIKLTDAEIGLLSCATKAFSSIKQALIDGSISSEKFFKSIPNDPENMKHILIPSEVLSNETKTKEYMLAIIKKLDKKAQDAKEKCGIEDLHQY